MEKTINSASVAKSPEMADIFCKYGKAYIQDSLPLGRSGGTSALPFYYPPLLISSYVISMSVPG